MSEITEDQKKIYESEARRAEEINAQCNTIDDPVRRGHCKVCGTPAAGALPFCRQHEPTVR